MPLLLNVGCGKYPIPDYLNVDSDPAIGSFVTGLGLAFERAEAHELRVESGSVKTLYASHILEHYLPEDAVQEGPKVTCLLAEWHRVLAPGGLLYVAVPDLAICAFRILSEKEHRADWIHQLFGFQRKPGDTHHFAYTKEMLISLLERNGYAYKGPFDPWVKNPVGDGFDCAGAHGLDDHGAIVACSLNLRANKAD